MTTITLPPRVTAVPEMEARASAVGDAGDAVRLSARGLEEAVGDAVAGGLPEGFEGDAARAAGSAMTAFGDDGDAVVAALLRGLTAIEAYAADLDRLEARRTALNDRASDVNAAIDTLAADIDGAPAEQVPALTQRRDVLQRRVDTWLDDERTWDADVTAAEERLTRALQAVDTVAEGEDAAEDPGRPDTDALADRLRELQDDAAAAHRWWESLSPAEREALGALHPDLVGSTDGVPAVARDEANRSSLAEDVADLEAIPEDERTEEQQRLLERAQAAQDALELGAGQYDTAAGGELQRLLLLYQPDAADGDGFAALAFGDPDTADHTSVSVPGITNDGSNIGSNGREALALWRTAAADGSSVSTIAWIGYDAPTTDELADIGSVGWEARAAAGGADLADFIDGLRATHEGEPTDLTAIGHSYGSSTLAHALAGGAGDDVDAGVLLGSPGAGLGNDSADDLVGPDGELYVGARDRDPVTWLGNADGYDPSALAGVRGLQWLDGVPTLGLGADPAHDDFGATRIDVGEGDVNPASYLDNHTTYYSGDGLDHLGDIVADRPLDDGAVIDGRDQNGAQLAIDAGRDAVGAGVDHLVDEGTQWAGDRVDDLQDTAGDVGDWAGDRADDAGEVLDGLGEVLAPRPISFGGLL